MPNVHKPIKSKEMILTLKILMAVLGIAAMLYLFWLIRTIITAMIFDKERCKDCPMKGQCFDALSLGFPALCNTSEPLHTSKP